MSISREFQSAATLKDWFLWHLFLSFLPWQVHGSAMDQQSCLLCFVWHLRPCLPFPKFPKLSLCSDTRDAGSSANDRFPEHEFFRLPQWLPVGLGDIPRMCPGWLGHIQCGAGLALHLLLCCSVFPVSNKKQKQQRLLPLWLPWEIRSPNWRTQQPTAGMTGEFLIANQPWRNIYFFGRHESLPARASLLLPLGNSELSSFRLSLQWQRQNPSKWDTKLMWLVVRPALQHFVAGFQLRCLLK